MNLSVYLSIYQFEKTEKKGGAGPLSSFFGTKRRTQGLYFPFVFLPFVFESPQSPDPVRTHFSRFVIFYWVGHISNLASKIILVYVPESSNARVYISLATNRIDAQGNEGTALPDESQLIKFTEYLVLHESSKRWASGSRPFSKLWQATLRGHLFNKESSLYLVSPKISLFAFFVGQQILLRRTNFLGNTTFLFLLLLCGFTQK